MQNLVLKPVLWNFSVCLCRHRYTASRIHHHPKAHDLNTARGKTLVTECLDLIKISLVKQREIKIDPSVIALKGCTVFVLNSARQPLWSA